MKRAAYFLIASVVAASTCFAQVDATKATKTVKAPPPEIAAMASPGALADLSFKAFLNDYAWKSYTSDVRMQYPYLDKKAYTDDRKYLVYGTVRITVDIDPTKACITSTILQYGIVRKGCVDAKGVGQTVFRGYAVWHGPVASDTIMSDSSRNYNDARELNWDKFENPYGANRNPGNADFSVERYSVSADGIVIHLPLAKFNDFGDDSYISFDHYHGTCVSISRSALNSGKAALVRAPCSSAD